VQFDSPGSIDALWQALTNQNQVAIWWDTGIIESIEGGAIHLGPDSAPEGLWPLRGQVKVCAAPHLFEFTWHENYPSGGLVRFDLLEVEAGTRITLTQNVPAQHAQGAAEGWQALLARLIKLVETGTLD